VRPGHGQATGTDRMGARYAEHVGQKTEEVVVEKTEGPRCRRRPSAKYGSGQIVWPFVEGPAYAPRHPLVASTVIIGWLVFRVLGILTHKEPGWTTWQAPGCLQGFMAYRVRDGFRGPVGSTGFGPVLVRSPRFSGCSEHRLQPALRCPPPFLSRTLPQEGFLRVLDSPAIPPDDCTKCTRCASRWRRAHG
jgi:hypothetical protein